MIEHIFLFGQLLCCATQATSLVDLTLHVLPQSAGYKQDISISLWWTFAGIY